MVPVNMNLISAIARRTTYLTAGTAGASYDNLVAIVRESLAAGKSITLPGIGRISVRMGARRFGFNPKTHERIEIPEQPRIKFTLDESISLGVPQ